MPARRSIANVMSIATGLIVTSAAYAADPTGTWSTEDSEARIAIAHCGPAFCGHIVALRQPRDPDTGQPKTDAHNRDQRLRSRPLLGVTIVIGMRPDGAPGHWSGHVYNPEDGGIYPAAISMQNGRSLTLRGCMMKGVLCRGQTWTRVK
jgi:uncharacterized protein (DUF2147 family)